MMPQFTIHTIDSAPEESKKILRQSEKSAGFIPNMNALMAESPLLLKTYKELGIYLVKPHLPKLKKK